MDWETLLDIDALSQKDNIKWVFKGASGHYPTYSKFLISLSKGGGDAVFIKEFDADKKQFIENGFAIDEAKGSASYFEYYNEESSSASSCLWVRGEHAWYRLEKPAACYLEVSRVEKKNLRQYLYFCASNASKLRLLAIMLQVSRVSENKLRIGDLLKSQLLKTPKVNFNRHFCKRSRA